MTRTHRRTFHPVAATQFRDEPLTPGELKRAILADLKLLGRVLNIGEGWKFVIRWDRDDEETAAYAGVTTTWEYKHATFTFDLGHAAWQVVDISVRETVAHELYHVKLAPIAATLLKLADSPQARAAYIEREEEIVVDLARARAVRDLE